MNGIDFRKFSLVGFVTTAVESSSCATRALVCRSVDRLRYVATYFRRMLAFTSEIAQRFP
jgi:hypothetical protein